MSSRLALAMSATALVVALLGSTPLGHALSSALPRNSVGPLQIKRNAVGPSKIAPNAVQTSHVLDGSLLTADFKPGQIPQGPKGDKGDKGDKGKEGKEGPPGISALQLVLASTLSSSTNFKQGTASCPTGTQTVGGGAYVNGVQLGPSITASAPSSQAWHANAIEVVATNASWSLHATVICAKVAP